MSLDRWYRGAKRLAELFDSLSFYYNLALAILFIWGVYAVFFNEPPNPVSAETSPGAYQVWLAWHVVAPPIIWLGQVIPAQRVQWWLRWAGDGALFVLATTYVLALHAQIQAQVLCAADFPMAIPVMCAAVAFCFSTRDLLKALSVSRGCHSNDG